MIGSSDGGSPMVGRMLTQSVGTTSVEVVVRGEGSLPSVFPVTELATASIAAAGVAVSEYLQARGAGDRRVSVDRRLASMWFASSLRPTGWDVPPAWDPVAGDYPGTDGWIRLHTNALAHREAALAVLGVPADRDGVARAVASWSVSALEAAVVAQGGCAARMQTRAEWAASKPGRHVAAEPLVLWEGNGAAGAPARLTDADPARPLDGIRVLDLTRVLAGPVATRFLAQLGADVLRVDPPWWQEPGLVPEVMLGKRSARMDLRRTTDRAQFLELLAGADILVHGYRPGALENLDLGRAVRQDARPGLVEVSLDAYGWSGPWSGRRGFDSLVQMSCGIADAGMRVLGREVPTPLPVQALDHATGYLMAHAAVRGLTTRLLRGHGSRASLSLARTAQLLTGAGTDAADLDLHSPLLPEEDSDLALGIEDTSWGPARRLALPLSIEGIDIRAVIPARGLGADAASW